VPLDTATLVSGLKAFGWLDLNNTTGQLMVAGTQLGFFGVDDAHDGLDDETVAGDAAHKIGGFKIGVSHAPYRRVIDAFEQAGCRVMFAGHTHGGQVCLPWFRAIITNCDLPAKYAKGLSIWGGSKMALNVTAGLGHSIYAPIRFFCRPEVRLLTLVAA
jgi:predicted MPP superfamily phosphohydrolase